MNLPLPVPLPDCKFQSFRRKNSLCAGSCPGNCSNTLFTENYIYHRMKDHPAETAYGLGVGLADEYGNLKQAWTVWALANRIDLDPPQLSCGFEHLPYTRLVRGFNILRGHWTSTRLLPDGFKEEKAYRPDFTSRTDSYIKRCITRGA